MVPELSVTNLERSLAFYEAAGFTVRFRRKDPNFAYIELGQVQLMLEEIHSHGWYPAPLDTPLGRGINFQMEVEDAAQIAKALAQQGVAQFRPLKETWYEISEITEEGSLEFLVQDPDGYLLRFAQPLGPRKKYI